MAVDLDKARAANESALYSPDQEVEIHPDGGTRLKKRSLDDLRVQQGLIDAATEAAAGTPRRPIALLVGSVGMYR